MVAAAAFEKNEHEPDSNCVEDDVIGEDGRYVSVPDVSEAGVERQISYF